MYRIDGITFVHNVFLDFYVYGGVVPFLVFSLMVGYLVYKLIKNAVYGRNGLFEIIIGVSLVGILSLGMMEPIYQANPNCLMPLFIYFFYIYYLKQNIILKHKNHITIEI